jgi:hypothetical protein
LKGTLYGPINLLSIIYLEGLKKNDKAGGMSSVWTAIGTESFPDTGIERYNYTNMLCIGERIIIVERFLRVLTIQIVVF